MMAARRAFELLLPPTGGGRSSQAARMKTRKREGERANRDMEGGIVRIKIQDQNPRKDQGANFKLEDWC